MKKQLTYISFFITYNRTNLKRNIHIFSYLYLEIFNNSKIAAPFYLRTFISKMTFSLSGYVGTSSMKSKRKVVFRSLYASQEIHVVLLLKLRVTLALSIRVRIRVDVKMMLPH